MTSDDIREIRKEKGWTQEKMADFLTVRRATVSDWENGRKKPIPSHIIRLKSLQMQARHVSYGIGTMCWFEGVDLKWKMSINECASIWEDDDPKALAGKVRDDLEKCFPHLLEDSEVLSVLDALIMEGD